MVFPVTFFPSIITVEVIDEVPTIVWDSGWDTLNLSGIGVETLQFEALDETMMSVDAADHVFSTNKDMTVTAMSIKHAGSGDSDFEIGYGPTLDSTSGWTKLWEGNVTTTAISLPRSIFIPAGNYLTVSKTNASGELQLVSLRVTQTVDNDSDLNDDMNGNSP